MYAIMVLTTIGRTLNRVLPGIFYALFFSMVCAGLTPVLVSTLVDHYTQDSSVWWLWMLLILALHVLLYALLKYHRSHKAYQAGLLLQIRQLVNQAMRNAEYHKTFKFGAQEAAECLALESEKAVALSPIRLGAFLMAAVAAGFFLILLSLHAFGFSLFVAATAIMLSLCLEDLNGRDISLGKLQARAVQLLKIDACHSAASGGTGGNTRKEQPSCMEHVRLGRLLDRIIGRTTTVSGGMVKVIFFKASLFTVWVCMMWLAWLLWLRGEPADRQCRLLGFAALTAWPLQHMVSFLFHRQVSLAALRRVLRVTRFGRHTAMQKRQVVKLTSTLAFHQVSFAYKPELPPILTKLDFTLRRGEVTTIILPDDITKTLLLHLLLGISAPSEGRILLDDIPMTRVDTSLYRDQAAVVDCDQLLLPGTLESNLTADRPAIASESYHATLVNTGIHDFLPYLPDGLATRINDPRAILSKGQKARLLLAKALFARPALLVVDCVFEKIDLNSRSVIQRAIHMGKDERLVVVLTMDQKYTGQTDHLYKVRQDGLSDITGTLD